MFRKHNFFLLKDLRKRALCFQKVVKGILFAVTMKIVQTHVNDVSHVTPLSKNSMVQIRL